MKLSTVNQEWFLNMMMAKSDSHMENRKKISYLRFNKLL